MTRKTYNSICLPSSASIHEADKLSASGIRYIAQGDASPYILCRADARMSKKDLKSALSRASKGGALTACFPGVIAENAQHHVGKVEDVGRDEENLVFRLKVMLLLAIQCERKRK